MKSDIDPTYMSLQRRSSKIIERAIATTINFAIAKTSSSGKRFVDVYFKDKKKKFRFCAEITDNCSLLDDKITWIRCAYNSESGQFNESHECDWQVPLSRDFTPPDYYIV